MSNKRKNSSMGFLSPSNLFRGGRSDDGPPPNENDDNPSLTAPSPKRLKTGPHVPAAAAAKTTTALTRRDDAPSTSLTLTQAATSPTRYDSYSHDALGRIFNANQFSLANNWRRRFDSLLVRQHLSLLTESVTQDDDNAISSVPRPTIQSGRDFRNTQARIGMPPTRNLMVLPASTTNASRSSLSSLTNKRTQSVRSDEQYKKPTEDQDDDKEEGTEGDNKEDEEENQSDEEIAGDLLGWCADSDDIADDIYQPDAERQAITISADLEHPPSATADSYVAIDAGPFVPSTTHYQHQNVKDQFDTHVQAEIDQFHQIEATKVKTKFTTEEQDIAAANGQVEVRPPWTCQKCQTENDDLVGSCAHCHARRPATWGQQFVLKEGTWKCEACAVVNKVDDVRCRSCTTPRDGAAASAATDTGAPNAAGTSGSNASIGPGGFSFGRTTGNTGTASIGPGGFTFSDASSGGDNGSSSGGFVFGGSAVKATTSAAPSNGGFVFGGAIKTDTAATSTPAPSGGFSFGSPPASAAAGSSAPAFSFGSTLAAATDTTTTKTPASTAFTFGSGAGSTKAADTGEAFGLKSTPAAPDTTTTAALNTGFTFGSTSAATESVAPSTGFSFGAVSGGSTHGAASSSSTTALALSSSNGAPTAPQFGFAAPAPSTTPASFGAFASTAAPSNGTTQDGNTFRFSTSSDDKTSTSLSFPANSTTTSGNKDDTQKSHEEAKEETEHVSSVPTSTFAFGASSSGAATPPVPSESQMDAPFVFGGASSSTSTAAPSSTAPVFAFGAAATTTPAHTLGDDKEEKDKKKRRDDESSSGGIFGNLTSPATEFGFSAVEPNSKGAFAFGAASQNANDSVSQPFAFGSASTQQADSSIAPVFPSLVSSSSSSGFGSSQQGNAAFNSASSTPSMLGNAPIAGTGQATTFGISAPATAPVFGMTAPTPSFGDFSSTPAPPPMAGSFGAMSSSAANGFGSSGAAGIGSFGSSVSGGTSSFGTGAPGTTGSFGSTPALPSMMGAFGQTAASFGSAPQPALGGLSAPMGAMGDGGSFSMGAAPAPTNRRRIVKAKRPR